jgi:mRNA interferase RelE/StbE
MAWTIEFSPGAKRDVDKLDRQHAKRILRFLFDRLASLEDPRSIGEPMVGPKCGEFWKYRVGDYRILAKMANERFVVVVVKVGHRREVYRD